MEGGGFTVDSCEKGAGFLQHIYNDPRLPNGAQRLFSPWTNQVAILCEGQHVSKSVAYPQKLSEIEEE
jgi:hypothetical protein